MARGVPFRRGCPQPAYFGQEGSTASDDGQLLRKIDKDFLDEWKRIIPCGCLDPVLWDCDKYRRQE